MRKSGWAAWRFVAMVAIVLGGAAGCSRPAPEQALRERLGSLQGSIERRDAAGVEDVLADDFIGPGGLDREGAGRMARVSFLRYRDVGVDIGPLAIRMQDDHATAGFTAVLRGGQGVLPQRGQIYDVRTAWRLDGDEWVLVDARWEPRL